MPLAGNDLVCPKFQPNIFDASRCHDCLRQRRLHAGEGDGAPGAAKAAETAAVPPSAVPAPGPGPGPGAVPEPEPGLRAGAGTVAFSGTLLPRLPGQTEEKDGSTKAGRDTRANQEDSDGLSVVSSYCDVRGGHRGYGESSLCILSPECALYICDGDEDSSTDSCAESDDPELCGGSVSTEDDDLPPRPRRRRPAHLAMTRLDPPPHRPNPRAWMEEARSRGNFSSSRSEPKGARERDGDRESGYFSLGQAGGVRASRDAGTPPPSLPYRHLERGHPLYSRRNPEPKDAVPFRNPNLGVASERLIPELLDGDLPPESPPPPPDPYDVAVEVEAQVGPRSPSPTPFKIAESLASAGRSRGFGGGAGGGSRSPPSYQRAGRFDPSGRGSALPSRSSSPPPPRGASPFKRSESAASLNRKGVFDGGGGARSQGRDLRSRSPAPNSYGRGGGVSGTLPRNFKSSPGSAGSKAPPNNFADFRNSLRGGGEANGGRGTGSSPPRRGYDAPALRKSESSPPSFKPASHSLSKHPSRETEETEDGDPTAWHHGGSGRLSRSPDPPFSSNGRASPPPPSRRSYDPPGRPSPLRKAESVASLNGRGHRCGSPVREGYDIESQSLMKEGRETWNSCGGGNAANGRDDLSPSPAPSRKGFDAQSQSLLRKSEPGSYGNSRGRDSRAVSPSRRGYEAPGQSSLGKSAANANGSLSSRGRQSRNSSPARRDYEPPGQSLLRKHEAGISARSRDGRGSSPSGRGYEPPGQSLLRKSETGSSARSHSRDGRSSSPSRGVYEPPGQSLLRKSETNGSVRSHSRDGRSSSPPRGGYEPPGQSLLRKSETNGSVRSHSRDGRSSSPSRRGYEPPGQSLLRKSETNGSVRSYSRDGCGSSPSRGGYDPPGQSLLRKSETNGSARSHSRDGRGSSPPRGRYEAPSQPPLRKTDTGGALASRSHGSRGSSPSRRGDGDSSSSYQRRSAYSETRTDSAPSPASWRDSAPSLRAASPSRHARAASSHRAVTVETPGGGGGRRGPEARSSSPSPPPPPSSNYHHRLRGPSPSHHAQRHTSSQSSMESSESGRLSGSSGGRSREEYVMMADLPRVKPVLQREGPGQASRTQSRPPSRQELFKPASHSLSKHPSRETEETEDRDPTAWHHGGSGRLSRSHSPTFPHAQRASSPNMEENGHWRGQQDRSPAEQMQPDLLNFKKGWMSKLDEHGEWKKHWFVLTDAGLRYYRDSGAEEKDDLDGEIDLKSCVKVSEFDVEKNYGFQIQTREAVFTLSAMTAGIRRNWIEVLRKSVRPSSSPDLTQLPDSSSDKENSHARSLTSSSSSSRRPSSRLHGDARSESPASSSPALRRIDHVELSPVPAGLPAPPPPAAQREAGEGRGREHAQWQEERGRDAASRQWEAVLSRKGPGFGSDPRLQVEEEIERRWAEFERLPLKEMRSLPTSGSRSGGQPANEALQREVASLRQQLERLKGGGGGGRGGGGGCGPAAPCGQSLEAMERAHRQALDELQRQHGRQTRELEAQRDRLLQEETQATAQVMEALKKAHREELEREVEKARRLGGGVDSQSLRAQQQADQQSLQRELSGLSDRYSQKCLELNRAQQSGGEREREMSRKEREMEQLRKENQDLQARLAEEIGRMRSLGSEGVSNDNRDRTSSELEVLLRVKENEVQYLHKEISCLRNELQFLSSEKRLACERYKEVHEELSGMKSRCEREVQGLREHLRLAMAALQEGQTLGNSLEH